MTRKRGARSPRPDARRVPTGKEWEDAKPAIEDLYIRQGFHLQQVQDEMKQQGFIASERMYKTRLALWGFCKNITKKDWQVFATMRHQREATGKPFSRLEIHRKIKSERDFRDYLKLQNVSEEDFVREAIASSMTVPSHFRYRDSPSLSPSPVAKAAPIAGSEPQQIIHADQPRQVQANVAANSAGPGSAKIMGTLPVVSSYLSVMGSAVNPTRQETASASNAMRYGAASFSSATIDRTGRDRGFTFHGQIPFQGQVSFQEAAAHGSTTARNSGFLGPFPPNWPNAVHFAHDGLVLPNYMSQVIEPEAGVMPVGPPYSDFGGMLGQILSPGFADIANINVSDETGGYQAFMSDTMMACISEASKEFSLCGQWIEKASFELRRMCNSLDHLLLVTLCTVLVWLQVHDQGGTDGSIGIAESLMRDFSRVAVDALGQDASVCLILQWMTAAAGKKLADCRITSDMLHQVWTGYKNVLGCKHPNTIVALYCFSFHLITVNKSYAEAEAHLRWAHEAAVDVFGASHLQSLNILATLSRAQLRQDDLPGALETMRRCVKEEPLGQNHPHRLMLLLRMAIICGRMGMLEERERLYWIVVEGRAATLGSQHKSTKSAYESLVHILQEAGKWESAKDQVEKILSNPQVAVSEYENRWYRMVEQGQSAQKRRAASEEME